MKAEQSHLSWTFAGVSLLVAIWWALAASMGSLVLATPPQVLLAAKTMLAEPESYAHLGISLLRLVLCLSLSAPIGIALALLSSSNRKIEQLLEPLRWISMTIPPIIVVVILMYSLGMGTRMIVCFGSLILWPVMYVNVIRGSRAIDAQLLEMSRLFEFSLINRLKHIILPAIMPAILAGAAQVCCGAIRVVTLAEVIGANEGVGAALTANASNLNTARMNTWALVTLLLAIFLEFALLRPLQKRADQWRTT